MHKKMFEELIAAQQKKIFSFARKIIPYITQEDLLQPNDFIELEQHPLFRYEEGILEGLRTAYTAYLAQERDLSEK